MDFGLYGTVQTKVRFLFPEWIPKTQVPCLHRIKRRTLLQPIPAYMILRVSGTHSKILCFQPT